MQKKEKKAWVWLVGVVAVSALMLGCASVQTGGAAKEEAKPAAELAEPNAKSGNFWKDDELIMKLGDKRMTYADMSAEFLRLSDGTAKITELPKDQQLKFFNRYYFEKLFAKEALERGIEKTQDYIDRTRAKKYRILNDVYKRWEIAEKIKPTDEYIMQFVPPAEDEVQVRVIVKSDIAEARKVYERAKAGEDFVALCQEVSEGFQRADGGLSPWLSPHNSHKYPPPVVEKFRAQEIGTVLEPFYMDIGFLIIKVVEKRSAEQLRKYELEIQRAQRTYDYQKYYYDTRVKELTEKANVKINNEVVDAFAKGSGTPSATIMEVGGIPYLASEVLEEMIDAGHGGQPVRQRVEGFVEVAVIGQESESLGLDKHPAFLDRWTLEEDRTLARELSRTTVTSVEKGTIPEADLLDYVKANPDKFMLPESRLVLAIMTDKKEVAEEVVERLGKGEAFGELASKYSGLEDSASKGGELGWAEKGTLPEAFQEVVFKLDEGAYTKVPLEVRSKEETPLFFILKVGGVQKPSPAPPERVNLRSAETKVRAIKRANALGTLAEELQKKHGYELCIKN